MMTTVPTWAAITVSIGTPVVTFFGVLLAQWIARKGSKELETRSRREEVMRNARWAAELAVDEDQAKANLGVSQLNALSQSNLNDEDVQALVDAALESVIEDVVGEIDEAGGDADVELGDLGPGTPAPVRSETRDVQEGANDGER